MKRILIINTGGTLSSEPGIHGLTPGSPGNEIKKVLNTFEPEIKVELEDYCSLDSSNIMPIDWKNLAEQIGRAIVSNDGIVIIHGTDTMSYTASMLSFMLQKVQVPVVLTGSQLPIGVPLSDAADNLRCSVQMAASGVPGVFIVFDRKIMLGCRTSKVRTLSFNAFESINYHYVGEFNALGMQLYDEPAKNDGIFQVMSECSDNIAVLKLFPGMHPDIFSYLYDKGCEGVYIEGFGLGGVPFLRTDFTGEILKASKQGMPILVGSQCRYEGSNLNVYETGQRVLDCGGIPVYDMTQEAVVTKLMWCLGQKMNRQQIKEIFATSLVNEVTIL